MNSMNRPYAVQNKILIGRLEALPGGDIRLAVGVRGPCWNPTGVGVRDPGLNAPGKSRFVAGLLCGAIIPPVNTILY